MAEMTEMTAKSDSETDGVLRPPTCFSKSQIQILDHIEDGHTNAALDLLRQQGPIEDDINAKGPVYFQANSVETVYSYKTKRQQYKF